MTLKFYINQGAGCVEVKATWKGLAMRIVSVNNSPRYPLTSWRPISLLDLAKLIWTAR